MNLFLKKQEKFAAFLLSVLAVILFSGVGYLIRFTAAPKTHGCLGGCPPTFRTSRIMYEDFRLYLPTITTGILGLASLAMMKFSKKEKLPHLTALFTFIIAAVVSLATFLDTRAEIIHWKSHSSVRLGDPIPPAEFEKMIRDSHIGFPQARSLNF